MNFIFCKIIAKEIVSHVIREENEWIAIRDVQPQAPHHLLLIPKRHLSGLPECASSDESLLGSLILGAARIARDLGVEGPGYRVVINSGEEGGQSVGHLHAHLIAGRPMRWPPG